jgi:hypothetical protein
MAALGWSGPAGHSVHVTEHSDVRGVDPQPAPDLEYDLAHEAGIAASGDAPPPHPSPAGPEKDAAVYVATETKGYDGDYGYDLAHDVPRR